MKTMSQKKYLKHNGNKCPNCKSENITAEPIESDGLEAWGNVVCRNCNCIWADEYKLIKYIKLSNN